MSETREHTIYAYKYDTKEFFGSLRNLKFQLPFFWEISQVSILLSVLTVLNIVVNKLYFAEQGGVHQLINLMKTETDPDLQTVIGSVVWNFGENCKFISPLHVITPH